MRDTHPDADFLRSLGILPELASTQHHPIYRGDVETLTLRTPILGPTNPTADQWHIPSPPLGLIVERRNPEIGELIHVETHYWGFLTGYLTGVTFGDTWHIQTPVGCVSLERSSRRYFGVVRNHEDLIGESPRKLRWITRATAMRLTRKSFSLQEGFAICRDDAPSMLIRAGDALALVERPIGEVVVRDGVIFADASGAYLGEVRDIRRWRAKSAQGQVTSFRVALRLGRALAGSRRIPPEQPNTYAIWIDTKPWLDGSFGGCGKRHHTQSDNWLNPEGWAPDHVIAFVDLRTHVAGLPIPNAIDKRPPLVESGHVDAPTTNDEGITP